MFCAIVSHPADSVVSVLNKEKGSSASQVLMRLGFKGTSLLSCIFDQVFVVFWGGFLFFLASYATRGLCFALQVYGKVCLLVSL